MGTVTLNKSNRLFWLGRYCERLFQGVTHIRRLQDVALDGAEIDVAALCNSIGINNIYSDLNDFFLRYLFDRENPESLMTVADALLGNGMVLRETISSEALSYLQMALTAMELASKSSASGVELQWVLDDLYAFQGCCFDYMNESAARNTIRSGISVERVSIMLSFDEKESLVRENMQKMMDRLYKTRLGKDSHCLELVSKYAFGEEECPDQAVLRRCVEDLVLV